MRNIYQHNYLPVLHFMRFFLILISASWFLSALKTCDLPTTPGPQPTTLIDTEFEPGLNIFGVLRADSVSGSSFIHVERAVTTEQMYVGEGVIDTAAVVLVTDSLTGEEYLFEAIDDSLHAGYYYNADFQPVCGHRYLLEVRSGDLPILTATTTVPNRPQIVPNSLILNANELSFKLIITSDIAQYICYLLADDNYIEKQILNSGAQTAAVSFNLAVLGAAPVGLIIVGYDENLKAYTNSTPSFIPQTYHEMVNTVTNGYGCFGSLAVTVIGL